MTLISTYRHNGRLIPIAAAMAMLCGCSAGKVISIHNPSAQDLHSYIAEIDIDMTSPKFKDGFVVRNESGDIVPSQVTYDNRLLIETDVRAGRTRTLRLTAAPSQAFDTVCVGQIRHDFQDDFTWENDKGGYRLYGPAYRNGGGNVSGYDIWTKSVAYPVLSQRYHDHCKRGISYHKDHGNGMDAYTVGRTLGAGMI